MSSIKSSEPEKKQEAVVDITSVDVLDEKSIKELDVAYKFKEKAEGLDVSPEEEKKLVRKIDLALLPLLGMLMACQNMDKSLNSYAAIMGMREDLNFLGQSYSWVGSSFYFGYMVFQYVAVTLLQVFPLSKTMSIFIFVWGIVLCCHAACQNAASFLAVRVILGCLESSMNPAYMILTSMWYSREEKQKEDIVGKNDTASRNKANQQYIKTSIWYGLQGIGNFLAALISYGLYRHTYTIPSWKVLYIVCGIKTIVLGIISWFHIPDIPVKAWFLTEREKSIVVERSRKNQQGFGNRKVKKDQIIEAVLDVRSYLLFFYGVSYCMANGGYTNFGSILLNQDFNFSTDQSLLMNMIGGSIDIISGGIAFLLCFIFRSRLIVGSIINTFILMGMLILAFASNRGARLFGYYTFYLSTAVMAVVISYIGSNIGGSTKKSVVYAFFSIGYCVGNIIGPQTYRAEQAPKYVGARTALIVAFVVSTACLLGVYVIDRLENRRRDKREAAGETPELPKGWEFADLTDKQNPNFRYCG